MTSTRTGQALEQYTLDNGLRVVVQADHTAPAVAVNLWYHVGSRHEQPGRTGLAHLFEHLMFQGSANVASGEHFNLLEPLGARLNATTSFERTNYFETVPAGAFELALWLEADRMASLPDALDQLNLDRQRDVVKNERRQRYDNQPYGTAWEELFAATFPVDHPLHHMPIGSMADLDAAALTDCADFFHRHYAPANAVLSVVGDVSSADALRAVERYFATIPAVAAPAQPSTAPLGPNLTPRHIDMAEDVPVPALYRMWRSAPDGTTRADATDLALQILAGDEASRLARTIVHRDQLATNVVGQLFRFVSADSAAALIVNADPGADLDRLVARIDEELEAFARSGPTDEELRRAIAMLGRQRLDDTADYAGRADRLARYASLHGDAALADAAADAQRAVTVEQVRQAARQLLPEHATQLRYPIPGGDRV